MIIVSSDQKIKSSFICKESDKFEVLEEKIYEKYPNVKNKMHVYLYNGEMIDIKKTLKEYRIKNGSHILICFYS